MKLKKVKIFNFRSFGEEQVIDIENFSAIVGANSSGKTTFFNALLKIFGQSSSDKEIRKSDFHVPIDKDPNSINENRFYIEIIFEFDEVINKNGVEEYTVPSYYESFIVEDKDKPPYIRIKLESEWKKSNQPEGIIDSKIYFVLCKENEVIKEEDKKDISKSQLSMIKLIYIPAVRDPYEQLKNATGSILWRLLNGININEDFKFRINEKLDEVNKQIDEQPGIAKIKSILENQWGKYHNDNRYNKLDLQYNTTDIESILKKIDAKFSPTEIGSAYTINDLGDGLRSLFYFTLVGTLLKVEEETLKDIINNPECSLDDRTFGIEPPCLTIILVEEPENHVSPHLLGKIVSNLRNISKNNNSQIILSSHSSSIIKRVEPEEIRHFRSCKVKFCTMVNKIVLPKEEDLAYKYVKEAVKAYPEIYFSNLIILGEGDSEEIIIPKILNSADIEINFNEIAIVPLGGRHVNHFWRLLNQLEIPYITLLDFDLEREGGGWGRIRYVIKQLIEVGYSKDEILKLDDEYILSDKELESMHLWDELEKDSLKSWMDFLEEYNVFFSAPLDIDFLMLSKFKEEYINTIDSKSGPKVKIDGKDTKIKNLKEKDFESDEYKDKINNAVWRTLKSEDKNGQCYSEEEKELMIWYNYLFLGRGKPVTHIFAVNSIKDEDFKANLPSVFERMVKAIKKKLDMR